MGIRNILKIIVKDVLLRKVVLTSARGTKCVAITFDDGPHPEYTLKLLEILRSRDATATFFTVGQNVLECLTPTNNHEQFDCEVANHSMTHAEFKSLDFAGIVKEIKDASSVLKERFHHYNNVFRPPKGVFNLKVIFAAWRTHVKIVLWNLDPKDYKANSKQEIIDYFHSNPIKGGDIILLHDVNPHTVEALPELLELIHKKGLIPVTVSDLFGFGKVA